MKAFPLIAALLMLHVGSSVAAGPGPGCAAKRADIEASLAEASARGNQREIAGLKKALRANKSHCTEASLKKVKDARARKARQEVAERERDLARAEKDGDAEKVQKRRAKLEEARQELSDAEKP